MSLEEINKDNLTSIYNFIGNNVIGFNLEHNLEYSSISSSVNCWPNCIWNINEKSILTTNNSSTLFTHKLQKGQLLVASDDITIASLFKQSACLLLDQWKGMCLEISEKKYFTPKENYNLKIIDKNFGDWIAFVSKFLFKGGHLSEEMFIKLTRENHIVIGLYRNNQIIGSTLLYFDENNNGSLYMVCIDSDYRGLGLGKLIVNYATDVVKEKDINKVILQSTRAGYLLYKSLGFIETNTYNLFIKK